MKLHIGSGLKRIPGWSNVDIRESTKPDYLASAEALTFAPTDSVDAIYASHVLEHYPLARTPGVLEEWHRVLVPQHGKLYVAVPDIRKLFELYVWNGIHLERLRGLLWGGQTYPENYHFTGWDYETLACDLRPWFFNIKQTHFDFLPEDYRDFSMMELNGIRCSLNVEAIAI
jgi:predicted SAM-dependent methyltransferase